MTNSVTGGAAVLLVVAAAIWTPAEGSAGDGLNGMLVGPETTEPMCRVRPRPRARTADPVATAPAGRA